MNVIAALNTASAVDISMLAMRLIVPPIFFGDVAILIARSDHFIGVVGAYCCWRQVKTTTIQKICELLPRTPFDPECIYLRHQRRERFALALFVGNDERRGGF